MYLNKGKLIDQLRKHLEGRKDKEQLTPAQQRFLDNRDALVHVEMTGDVKFEHKCSTGKDYGTRVWWKTIVDLRIVDGEGEVLFPSHNRPTDCRVGNDGDQ